MSETARSNRAPATDAVRTAPAPRPRRPHPSHRARAVALASSVLATGGLSVAMSMASHGSSGGTVTGVAASTPSAPSGSPTTVAPTGSAATAAFTDGTYLGSEVTNKYGPVEVQVTVSGGKVSAVSLAESPSDGKSQRINAQAAPVLEQEAVAAQSSTLDIVSGATYTSQSYASSLQSALDQAGTTAASAAASAARSIAGVPS